MIIIKTNINNNIYICPKCKQKIMFKNYAPSICTGCSIRLMNIEKLLNTKSKDHKFLYYNREKI